MRKCKHLKMIRDRNFTDTKLLINNEKLGKYCLFDQYAFGLSKVNQTETFRLIPDLYKANQTTKISRKVHRYCKMEFLYCSAYKSKCRLYTALRMYVTHRIECVVFCLLSRHLLPRWFVKLQLMPLNRQQSWIVSQFVFAAHSKTRTVTYMQEWRWIAHMYSIGRFMINT